MSKLLMILATGLVVLTSACSTTGTVPDKYKNAATYTLTQAERVMVEEGVRVAMKDPASAILGDFLSASKGSDGVVFVCGTVNAKNSYGGYTGFKPFIGTLGALTLDGKTIGSFSVNKVGSTSSEEQAVLMTCRDFGARLN